VRAETTVLLEAPGGHRIEVAPVGAHRVWIDGELVSESRERVGAEVVLDSSHNHPTGTVRTITVTEPRRVPVVVEAQVVDAEGFGRFARIELRHGTPGPSAEDDIADAVRAATAADVAIVVVGTTPETESEGWDRPDLDLPGHQNELVRRVLAANPRTVVIVNAGAPVELPWLDEVPAVLWSWLLGQEVGGAIADVLLGATEPSGRLPWTLPRRHADSPVPFGLPQNGRIRYDEGVLVGHRGWDAAGLEPAREFGFGLGYTEYSYDDLTVSRETDGGAIARVRLTNTGGRDGREVVQLYLEPPAGSPAGPDGRPIRWLAGFAVVDLAAGATDSVAIDIERRAFETWDTGLGAWTLPTGQYRVRAGRSSRDLRLTASLDVDDAGPGTPRNTPITERS
jgi:beta-glucosidase